MKASSSNPSGRTTSSRREARLAKRDEAIRNQQTKEEQEHHDDHQEEQLAASATTTTNTNPNVVVDRTNAPTNQRTSEGIPTVRRSDSNARRKPNQKSSSSFLRQRLEMMDNMPFGENGIEQPSARVIKKSSKRNILGQKQPQQQQQQDQTSSSSPKQHVVTVHPPPSFSMMEEEEEQTTTPQQQQQEEEGHSSSKAASSSLFGFGPGHVLKSDSIIERRRPMNGNDMNTSSSNHSSSDRSAAPTTLSRFRSRTKQQQQQQPQTNTSSNFVGGTKGGFPSLDDKPIGFLSRRHTRTNKSQEEQQWNKHLLDNNIKKDKQQPTTKEGEERDQISKSSDLMIQTMSMDEIQDTIDELHSRLSPELISILKHRRRGTKNHPTTTKKDTTSRSKTSHPATEQNQGKHNESGTTKATTNSGSRTSSSTTTVVDKVTFDQLLSSIQTEDELDNMFEQYQTPFEKDKIRTTFLMNVDDERDSTATITSTNKNNARCHVRQMEFNTATALLRSTSSKQRLLGAKTIQMILEDEIISCHKQQQAKDNHNNHNKNNVPSCPSLVVSPYLSVSLRCLLDVPNPHKHTMLHSYVLRSLTALTCLLCYNHHLCHFTNFAIPTHLIERCNNKNGDLKELTKTCDSFSYYQEWFMEDGGIPSPNMDELFKSNVGGTSVSESGACYVTNASSQSAVEDGTLFYKDPLWTLLSKMRIIPCVSHLLKTTTTNHITVECYSSICSLLGMLGTRMVGAAKAIVDQRDILPRLMEYAFIVHDDDTTNQNKNKNNDKDDNEEIHTNAADSAFVVDLRYVEPCLLLLITLVRQSRYVVTTVVGSSTNKDIINPIFHDALEHVQTMLLPVKAITVKERHVQRLGLVLWRSLLRYGLGISHLSTFVMLAASEVPPQQLQLPSSSSTTKEDGSIYPMYLSCFTIISNIVSTYLQQGGSHFKKQNKTGLLSIQQRRSGSASNKYNQKETEILAMAGLWFTPHVKQCQQFVMKIASSSTTDATARTSSSLFGSSSGVLMNDHIEHSAIVVSTISSTFHFLTSFLVTATPTNMLLNNNKRSGSVLEDIEEEVVADTMYNPASFVSILSTIEFVNLLQSFSSSSVFNDLLHYVVDRYVSFQQFDGGTGTTLEMEGAACACLKSFFIALRVSEEMIYSSNVDDNDDEDTDYHNIRESHATLCHDVNRHLETILFEKMHNTSLHDLFLDSTVSDSKHEQRRCWFNQVMYEMTMFLLRHHQEQPQQPQKQGEDETATATATARNNDFIKHVLRPITFRLLGQFQLGDESMTVSLLSNMTYLFLIDPHTSTDSENETKQRSDDMEEKNDDDDDVDRREEDVQQQQTIGTPLQRALLREFVGTQDSLNQLQHSCQLFSLLLTSSDQTFDLMTLLRRAERTTSSSSSSSKANNTNNKSEQNHDVNGGRPILPLGHLWLWNAVSSTTVFVPTKNQTSSFSPTNDYDDGLLNKTTAVLKECLYLIQDIEQINHHCPSLTIELKDEQQQKRMMEIGTKLYHITNIGLYPESILRDDTIQYLYQQIFQMYWNRVMSSYSNEMSPRAVILGYIQACHEHHQHGRSSSSDDGSSGNDHSIHRPILQLGNDGKKKTAPSDSNTNDEHDKEGYAVLKAALMGDSTSTTDDATKTNQRKDGCLIRLSKQEKLALTDFVDDLCQTFIEYGAQYDTFALGVRTLLHPLFPSCIRIKALHNLQDVLRLVTTEQEVNDDELFFTSLEPFLFSPKDDSDVYVRDPSDLLDSFSKILGGGRGMVSSSSDTSTVVSSVAGGGRLPLTNMNMDGGLCYAIAVFTLARNIVSIVTMMSSLNDEAPQSRMHNDETKQPQPQNQEISASISSNNRASLYGMRQRLLGIPHPTIQVIVCLVSKLLKAPTNRTTADLARMVMDASHHSSLKRQGGEGHGDGMNTLDFTNQDNWTSCVDEWRTLYLAS